MMKTQHGILEFLIVFQPDNVQASISATIYGIVPAMWKAIFMIDESWKDGFHIYFGVDIFQPLLRQMLWPVDRVPACREV